MLEPSRTGPKNSYALLIWAVSATLAAVIFGNLALFFWIRLREERAAAIRPVVADRRAPDRPLSPVAGAAPSKAFETLQDADVMGRYRFFESGDEVGTIQLLPNHSMINKDGTTFRQYHWEIRPEGIMTTWQRNDLLFDIMEKPGVYVAMKNGKEFRRIEKLAE